MKKVLLVGGFSETIELCELCNYSIVGIIDSKLKDSLDGYPIIGTDDDAMAIFKEYADIPLIIAPDNPHTRQKLVEFYKNLGFKFSQLISPKANISKTAEIGEGVIIQNLCNISSKAVIKPFTKINTYANIMHDAFIDEYVTIAPNAVILGSVNVGKLAYIGANSTILQTMVVGSQAIIGAGAVVNKDIPENCTAVGVPANPIKFR